MASIQQTKNEALATINAALTILEKYPDLSNTSINLSENTTLNPFTFLVDAFKSTTGFNQLIAILSKFISDALPPLELAVKGLLMSNMKELISCSINPFISDELLQNGIVFDLKQLDITNMLKTCPLDEKLGTYYYFGCDDMETTDEIKNSEDFNCLLWYMKNKALSREVWGMTEDPDDSGNEKLKKENGIITLEYTETSLSMKDALGGVYYTQTPYNNCLHVFIGNTKGINDPDQDAILDKYSAQIASLKENIEEINDEISDLKADLELLYTDYIAQIIDTDTYESEYETILSNISSKEEKIETYQNQLEELNTQKTSELNDYQTTIEGGLTYRGLSRNHYYRKTLVQFNYDYIYSLKLFDEKVVAAQLIDGLTGCLSINLNLSYSQKLIQEKTEKIIQQIIETDDAVVSDCFFTFSNDDYNAMLEKSEDIRRGILNIEETEMSNVNIDAESLLNSLNSISEASSKQEIQSIIEGSITEITSSISSSSYEEKESVNFGIRMSIIEQLMTTLTMSIVLSVLSPKIYLLLLINLQTLGQNTGLSLTDFIANFRQLMKVLIREVRDEIIQYLVTELLKLLKELAEDIAVKITIEQSAYYVRLIKRLIDCMKSNGDSTIYDWTQDEVSVDIYEEEEEPEVTEC